MLLVRSQTPALRSLSVTMGTEDSGVRSLPLNWTIQVAVNEESGSRFECGRLNGVAVVLTFAADQRVEIYGWITDADTGQGIPGALFLVLLPGITVDDFEWSEEELAAAGEADLDGYFELSAPLVRGESYSLIVGATGYDMISEDDVTVGEDVESPLEVEFELQQAQ